jgi:hypothetical protein
MCLLLGASPERLFFAEWSLQAGESRLAVMRAAPVQYSACPSCTGGTAATAVSSILCSTLVNPTEILSRVRLYLLLTRALLSTCLSLTLPIPTPRAPPPRSQPASQRSQHPTLLPLPLIPSSLCKATPRHATTALPREPASELHPLRRRPRTLLHQSSRSLYRLEPTPHYFWLSVAAHTDPLPFQTLPQTGSAIAITLPPPPPAAPLSIPYSGC